jgi:hypothetical protein
VYELRVYYAAEGKLDALHARFRDHTMKIFENHGMKNVGYFVPEGRIRIGSWFTFWNTKVARRPSNRGRNLALIRSGNR